MHSDSTLSERSKQVRRDTINLSIANAGYHYGGAFSAVEILIALYDHVLTEDDRFVQSKGHACYPHYVLLREKGLNPRIHGQPTRDPANGIHCTSGSLGQGFPTAVGMAMAKKIKGESGRVYVLVGDGECQEGATWESLLIAGQYELDNLVVIVDWNGCQGSGHIKDILPISRDCFANLVRSLGWHFDNVNGHNMDALIETFITPGIHPIFMIANTIKGKGVSFMEGVPSWHANWLGGDELVQAMEELS